MNNMTYYINKMTDYINTMPDCINNTTTISSLFIVAAGVVGICFYLKPAEKTLNKESNNSVDSSIPTESNNSVDSSISTESKNFIFNFLDLVSSYPILSAITSGCLLGTGLYAVYVCRNSNFTGDTVNSIFKAINSPKVSADSDTIVVDLRKVSVDSDYIIKAMNSIITESNSDSAVEAINSITEGNPTGFLIKVIPAMLGSSLYLGSGSLDFMVNVVYSIIDNSFNSLYMIGGLLSDSTVEDVTKVTDSLPEVEVVNPKIGDNSTKVNDDLSKIRIVNSMIDDSLSKVKVTSSKIHESLSKLRFINSKLNYNLPLSKTEIIDLMSEATRLRFYLEDHIPVPYIEQYIYKQIILIYINDAHVEGFNNSMIINGGLRGYLELMLFIKA